MIEGSYRYLRTNREGYPRVGGGGGGGVTEVNKGVWGGGKVE